MAKRRMKLVVTLPPYQPRRMAWRREINARVQERRRDLKLSYAKDDKLTVSIRLYLQRPGHRSVMDVDNCAKQIMDALQGRFGGSKKKKYGKRLIPNDSQVWRLIIEKMPPPKQSSDSGGRLTITKHSA